VNRRGYNGGGKTCQRSDLDHSPGPQDADEAGKKKIIARTNPARIPDIVEVDHLVEKFDFAGRGNLAGLAEFLCQLPILDFKLLPVLKLADVEIARRLGGRRPVR